MAGTPRRSLRRALAVAVLAGTAAIGAGFVTGVQHVGAQGIPNKTCTGSGASGQAEPGDTLTCVVSVVGVLVNGDTLAVEPLTPAGAAIPASGCVGVTAQGTAPFTYSTTVVQGATACTWTIVATTFGTAGNSVIGSEQVHIPSNTAVGTSVTQQAQQCGPPLPPAPALCSPFLPMGTSGAGSCVGGSAVPVIGGCVPALPLPTPTPTPTATPTASGSGTTSSSGGTGGVEAANSTPFTSGPDHPLPVGAALVAGGGVLLVLLAVGGPALLRRRRNG